MLLRKIVTKTKNSFGTASVLKRARSVTGLVRYITLKDAACIR